MSNYSNKEVLEATKELAKNQDTDTYKVFESDYKYMNLEFYDETEELYINEYVTIVNEELYTIMFEASVEYIDEEYEEMEMIVNSIVFDVDESLKEPQSNSMWLSVGKGALKGVLGGGVIGAIVTFINKKKKEKTAQ